MDNNFGVGGIANVLGVEGMKNSCFNCYTILIDEDEIDGSTLQADEINDFLLKRSITKLIPVIWIILKDMADLEE